MKQNQQLINPKTNILGENIEGEDKDGRFDFHGLVDSYESTAERISNLLLKEQKNAPILNEEALGNNLPKAILDQLKQHYDERKYSSLGDRELAKALYFTLKKADLRPLIQTALEQNKKDVEEKFATDIADHILYVHKNKQKDYVGFPFNIPENPTSAATFSAGTAQDLFDALHSMSTSDKDIKKQIQELQKEQMRYTQGTKKREEIALKIGFLEAYTHVGLIDEKMGKNIIQEKEGIDLFRKIEELFHHFQQPQQLALLDNQIKKLHELIQANVGHRNSVFGGNQVLAAGSSIGLAVAGLASNYDDYKALFIAAGLMVFGSLVKRLGKATRNTIEAYASKLKLEFEQLMQLEKLRSIVTNGIAQMSSEEKQYELQQIMRNISASTSQKNQIATLEQMGSGAILAGVLMLVCAAGMSTEEGKRIIDTITKKILPE